MRFTGAEEPGDPYAIGCWLVKISISEDAKTFSNIAGNHILLKLNLELPLIISFDDALNWAINRF